eukprot:Opistho-2@52851
MEPDNEDSHETVDVQCADSDCPDEIRVTASVNADAIGVSTENVSKLPPVDEDAETTALLVGSDGGAGTEFYRKRWNSIRIMYLTTFLTSIAFSILMTSLWPFLEKELGGTESFLGMVVGAYSLGQTIGSPIFGYWSNARPYREPLIVSTVINGLGNVMYCFSKWPAHHNTWFLLVARFIVGFSGGNVAVSRAYVSGATTLAERTHTMAMLSACQATGFIVGPLFGAAFSALHPGLQYRYFEFDLYTAPAYLSAVLAIVQLVLIILYFHEFQLDESGAPVDRYALRKAKLEAEARSRARARSSSLPKSASVDELTGEDGLDDGDVEKDGDACVDPASKFKIDYATCAGCIVMFFMIIFVFALYETWVHCSHAP